MTRVQLQTLAVLLASLLGGNAFADTPSGATARHEMLSLSQAMQLARQNREEIKAAHAAAKAAQERGRQSGALEDPMIMASIDHYPFERMDSMGAPESNGDFDWSLTLEQRFPLTRLRSHRRAAADAATARMVARTDNVTLDVMQQAGDAFLMLDEARRMLAVTENQITLAQQMVNSSAAQMRTGRGSQPDVLRAEVELARLEGRLRALTHRERAAVAMFNASIGRQPDAPAPALISLAADVAIAETATLMTLAFDRHPDLRAGQAEIAQARAENLAMQSMYGPMAVVRAGPASTMAEGSGAMLMLGISVPLWRNKVSAGAAEGRAMELMAQADFAAMRQMIAGEVAAAAESARAARTEVLALRDDIVPRARMAVAPSMTAYASGNAPLSAAIDALQSLQLLEAELVMAETELARSMLLLERITGSLAEITP
jgi:outer membrane protein, heavy metal efflux system